MDTGQGARFLSNDALGSVSDLTTASGSLYAKRQYDAWGQYRGGTTPAANQPKLGYTGHQFDPETGLVYARARYYDAESGVFLSRDSHEGELNEAPSLHRFAYAWGNPLRYWDATGFCTQGEEGCEVGIFESFSAWWNSSGDADYQKRREETMETHHQEYLTKQQEKQAEEAENGPGTVERAKRAVGEALDRASRWWSLLRAELMS